MQLLLHLFINTLAVVVASYILPGVKVDGFVSAFVVAIVLGALNAFVKPILLFLTLPLTVITFGIFAFILNGLIILLVSALVHGFRVDSLLWAIIFSLVITLVSSFLHSLT